MLVHRNDSPRKGRRIVHLPRLRVVTLVVLLLLLGMTRSSTAFSVVGDRRRVSLVSRRYDSLPPPMARRSVRLHQQHQQQQHQQQQQNAAAATTTTTSETEWTAAQAAAVTRLDGTPTTLGEVLSSINSNSNSNSNNKKGDDDDDDDEDEGGRPTVVSCLSHFGDFNAWEVTQQWILAAAASHADTAANNIVLVGIGSVEAAQQFQQDLELSSHSNNNNNKSSITLVADPTGAVTEALGCYKGWLTVDTDHAARYPQTSGNPYLKLLGMIVGFGSPGTLPAVVQGYTGDFLDDQGVDGRQWVVKALLQGSQKGRWPILTDDAFRDTPPTASLRPFELATLRFQTGLHIVTNWKTLGPNNNNNNNADLLTRMGGTFVIQGGRCQWSHYDQGILNYANIEEVGHVVDALAQGRAYVPLSPSAKADRRMERREELMEQLEEEDAARQANKEADRQAQVQALAERRAQEVADVQAKAEREAEIRAKEEADAVRQKAEIEKKKKQSPGAYFVLTPEQEQEKTRSLAAEEAVAAAAAARIEAMEAQRQKELQAEKEYLEAEARAEAQRKADTEKERQEELEADRIAAKEAAHIEEEEEEEEEEEAQRLKELEAEKAHLQAEAEAEGQRRQEAEKARQEEDDAQSAAAATTATTTAAAAISAATEEAARFEEVESQRMKELQAEHKWLEAEAKAETERQQEAEEEKEAEWQSEMALLKAKEEALRQAEAVQGLEITIVEEEDEPDDGAILELGDGREQVEPEVPLATVDELDPVLAAVQSNATMDLSLVDTSKDDVLATDLSPEGMQADAGPPKISDHRSANKAIKEDFQRRLLQARLQYHKPTADTWEIAIGTRNTNHDDQPGEEEGSFSFVADPSQHQNGANGASDASSTRERFQRSLLQASIENGRSATK